MSFGGPTKGFVTEGKPVNRKDQEGCLWGLWDDGTGPAGSTKHFREARGQVLEAQALGRRKGPWLAVEKRLALGRRQKRRRRPWVNVRAPTSTSVSCKIRPLAVHPFPEQEVHEHSMLS